MRAALKLACFAALLAASGCEKGEAPATAPTGEAEVSPTAPPIEAEPEPAGTAEPDEAAGGDRGEAQPAEPAPEAKPGELVVSKEPCQTDEDCVRATCCHASACVAKANGPKCDQAVCTMDCRAGTMDCGGGCLCHEGFCAAQLAPAMEAPAN